MRYAPLNRETTMQKPLIPRFIVNPLTITVVIFLVSRLLFYSAGIQFDASYVHSAWQAIDPVMLQKSPFESLWYLHSQPPALNVLVCAALHISTQHYVAILQVIFFLSGCGMSLVICVLLRMFGWSDWFAVAITSLFIISPASILYENYLFYEHLIAVLLCFGTLFLAKFMRTQRYGWGLLFFGVCSLTVLTRSMFHIIWFAAIVAGLMGITHSGSWRKKVALSAAIPFLASLGWHVKNAAIFGVFTSSTWLGFNLTRITVGKLEAAEREQLIADGTLTQVAAIPPFMPLSAYPDEIAAPIRAQVRIFPAADILRDESKSDGSPNFHYAGYITLARQYQENAFRLIMRKPGFYAKQVVNTSGIFFLPSSNYFLLEKNRTAISAYTTWFYLIALGGLPDEWASGLPAEKQLRICWWYVAGLFGAAGWWLTRLFRKKNPAGLWGGGRGAALLFAVFTIGYVFIISSLLEYGENNRFSFMIAPLALIVISATISDIKKDGRFTALLSRIFKSVIEK